MKCFLLFILPFLCVVCTPWDDCDGDDLICNALAPVLPQLERAIPYEGVETLRFRFEDAAEAVEVTVSQRELEARGQTCQDAVIAVLETSRPAPKFRASLETDVFELENLYFDFSFDDGAREIFAVGYDAAETASVVLPLNGRMIGDTTLAGLDFAEVFVVSTPDATESGQITAFYYSRVDGLLRVERLNAPAFFRVE